MLALEYVDLIYAIAERLPGSEAFNLRSQITRSATSVALNIAEGSTGQSDPEQARFVGMAIRSALETVACLHIIRRRSLVQEAALLDQAYSRAETLVAKLHTLRKTLSGDQVRLREDSAVYMTADEQRLA